MAGPLKLEVFASDSAAADPGPPMVPAQQMEEARLEAYFHNKTMIPCFYKRQNTFLGKLSSHYIDFRRI